jgi:hypothetical protein
MLYFSVFSDNVFSRLLLHPPCFFIFGVIAKTITQHVKKGCQWQPFDSVSGEVNAPPLTCRKAFRFCPSQNRPIILLHFGTFMTGRSAEYNLFRYVGYSEGDMAFMFRALQGEVIRRFRV